MVQSDANSEAIDGASQVDSQTKVSLGAPSWNLFSRFAPITKHQSKEFKTPYQINPEFTQKWEAAIAFTKTGYPIFKNFLFPKLPANSPSDPIFVNTFNGYSTSPLIGDSGAELLEAYQKYQLKKHRKSIWKKLIVGPQKALRKLAKINANFMGLGALYGTDDFGGEYGNS